jgi:hypothetical protein
MLFLIGCGNGATVKKPISRNFEDLTLGMSEEEFKSKVTYQQIPGRPYLAYSRMYNIDNGGTMKEVPNVYQVFCSFFNGRLYGISIQYSYQYHPSWDEFISNAKQEYGTGKEDAVRKSIEWNDGKTILGIDEEFGEQFDHEVNYYSVSYIDVELESQQSKQQQESSPKF